MTQRQALKLSIAHWSRMIALVKRAIAAQWDSFKLSDRPNANIILEALGETWYGKYCALCAYAARQPGAEWGAIHCPTCSLATQLDDCCNMSGSTWDQVVKAQTWDEWLVAAQKMRAQVKQLQQPSKRAIVKVPSCDKHDR
jgi:hypothetical protein